MWQGDNSAGECGVKVELGLALLGDHTMGRPFDRVGWSAIGRSTSSVRVTAGAVRGARMLMRSVMARIYPYGVLALSIWWRSDPPHGPGRPCCLMRPTERCSTPRISTRYGIQPPSPR